MSSQKLSLGQFVIVPEGNDTVLLRYSRDWSGSKSRVMSLAGGIAAAAAVVRGSNLSLAEVSVLEENADHVSYRLPASILKDGRFGFRLASNGKAMTGRWTARKAAAKRHRVFDAFLKANNISF